MYKVNKKKPAYIQFGAMSSVVFMTPRDQTGNDE